MQTDRSSFRKFYKDYYRYVFAIVAKYVPQKEDAEDIVSEVFINLYKIFDTLDSSSNIKSLVFTITKRRINDFLRKKYRLKEYEVNITDIADKKDKDEVAYYNKEKSSSRLLVKQMVLTLKAKYQELFRLWYQEGLPLSEVSKRMSITENYAKVINTRLIKKLTKLWETQNQKQN